MHRIALQAAALLPAAVLTALSMWLFFLRKNEDAAPWIALAIPFLTLIVSLAFSWLAARRLNAVPSMLLAVAAGEVPGLAVITGMVLLETDARARAEGIMWLPIMLLMVAVMAFPAALGGAMSGVLLSRVPAEPNPSQQR